MLVGIDEGLKHDSSIHCDEVVSLPKSVLTNFIGTLSPPKIQALNQALRIALDIPEYAPMLGNIDHQKHPDILPFAMVASFTT